MTRFRQILDELCITNWRDARELLGLWLAVGGIAALTAAGVLAVAMLTGVVQ